MKNLLFIISGMIILFAGCSPQNEKTSSQPIQPKSEIQQDVQLKNWEGGAYEEPLPDFFGGQSQSGIFPESMTGVWEADATRKSKWGIKFEPDGSIKKIIHSVAGPVNITKGGVDAEREDDGSYYVFVMGPCEARYIPKTKMVKVKIIIDYFIMKLPAGVIEGRIEDYIEGPVSKDGKKWNATWRNYTWVEGATPPPFDIIDENPVKLVFSKIDPNEPQQEN